MHEHLVYFGTLIGVMISLITLARFLFYTKTEVDTKFNEAKNESEKRVEKLLEKIADLQSKIKDEFVATKDFIHKNMIDNERNAGHLTQEFTNLVTIVKDELKNDSIKRYDDLLKLINNKVSVAEFDRLENKFDKVSETIIELKTIVERQLESKKKPNN